MAKTPTTSSEQVLCLSCTIARTREVQYTVECGCRRHAHISRQTWHALEKYNEIIQAHYMVIQHIEAEFLPHPTGLLEAAGYKQFETNGSEGESDA